MFIDGFMDTLERFESSLERFEIFLEKSHLSRRISFHDAIDLCAQLVLLGSCAAGYSGAFCLFTRGVGTPSDR